jgi:hypothetical protein
MVVNVQATSSVAADDAGKVAVISIVGLDKEICAPTRSGGRPS